MHYEHLLVAVADQAMRRTIKNAFENRYNLTEAKHGFETIRLAESTAPALIILDIEIPGISGIDCCRRLKANTDTKNIPVILICNRTKTEDIVYGLQAGADDYLTKPVDPLDLLVRVDAHLNYNRYLEGLEPGDLRLLLELSNSISVLRNPGKILQLVVEKVAAIIGVDRCSIVSINDNSQLTLKASNDLNIQEDIHLELDGYPEIRKALETRRAVVVNDTTSDPLMEPVRHQIVKRGLHSIFVVPIIKKESVIGSLFLGTATKLSDGISDRAYKLCHLVANISANALENAILFESMSTAKEVFEDFVTRDGLTRLYTHRHFYNHLEREFARTKRYGAPLSLLIFNMDDFRGINDRYGHLHGDEVLKQVGRLVRGLVRDIDVAARYAGDEFAILLPSTHRDGAFKLGRRLHKLINDSNFEVLGGGSISISAGVSTFTGDNFESYDQLVHAAAKALKQAKLSGKKKVLAFDDTGTFLH